MTTNVSVPEDSILRRHYEHMKGTGGIGGADMIPEDSILRRHYEQLRQAGPASATPAKAPAPAAPARPAQPAGAQAAAPRPVPAPAAKPQAAPLLSQPPAQHEGFFARLMRKLFGG
ncbi:MAG: hypothetical protein U1F68_11480 [Gammaproteobacteria bacterium]